MIIYDLDIHRSGGSLRPGEANPPPVVDADRVLPGSLALERLQSIAWQSRKISQHRRGVEPVKPTLGLPSETGKLPHPLTRGQSRCEPVAKANDHEMSDYRELRFP